MPSILAYILRPPFKWRFEILEVRETKKTFFSKSHKRHLFNSQRYLTVRTCWALRGGCPCGGCMGWQREGCPWKTVHILKPSPPSSASPSSLPGQRQGPPHLPPHRPVSLFPPLLPHSPFPPKVRMILETPHKRTSLPCSQPLCSVAAVDSRNKGESSP